MSDRPLLKPHSVIKDGDMSGNLTSSVTILQRLSMLSYGLSWSGTSPVGAVAVQVSNDYSIDPAGNVLNAGTWNAITFSVGGTTASSVAITGSSGNGFIDIDATGAYAMRLVYVRTSGTGTLQCVVNGKVM